MSNAYVRLVGRAIVAGLAAALVLLNTSSDWSTAWKGAAVAGILAFCEVVSPLNPNVGVGKKG